MVTKGAALAAGAAAAAAIGGNLADMPSLAAAGYGAGVLELLDEAEYDNKLNRKVGALTQLVEIMFMQTAMSSLV